MHMEDESLFLVYNVRVYGEKVTANPSLSSLPCISNNTNESLSGNLWNPSCIVVICTMAKAAE